MIYCSKCEAFENCKEKVETTTVKEMMNGIRSFVPGHDCPVKANESIKPPERIASYTVDVKQGCVVLDETTPPLNRDIAVKRFREILDTALETRKCRKIKISFEAEVGCIPLFDYTVHELCYKG